MTTRAKGAILIVGLVFSAIFFVLASSLVNVAQSERIANLRRRSGVKASAIAEAGLAYYRWHLAKAPSDYKDGTQQNGPYVHTYHDPSGGLLGYFSLDILPPSGCNGAVTITSTGWLVSQPDVKRSFSMQVSKPPISGYAAITDSNIWFRDPVIGRVHSNGGIRMDSTQNSIFTSSKSTYICEIDNGCNNLAKPGIWGIGSGKNQGLWQYPVSPIYFSTITQDLRQLRDIAIANNTYLGPSGTFGYRLELQPGGHVKIHKVTTVLPAVLAFNGTNWQQVQNDIAGQPVVHRDLDVPTNTCGPTNLIFVEDKAWVDGSYDYPITIVAGRLPDTAATNADIVINDNIINTSQTNGYLGLIAQRDIIIPLRSPNDLRIDAGLIAQNGHFFRHNYKVNENRPWLLRGNLTINGMFISKLKWAWSWVDTWGRITVGYTHAFLNYDSRFTANPPPFFPTTGDPKIINWQGK